MSVLGTHLYQCTSWSCCERLRLASVNFLKTLSMPLPILWWFTSTPAYIVLRIQQFWTENQYDPHAPPSLFTRSLQVTFFCFPRWKNFLKGKCFADVEEVKQKKWQKHQKTSKSTSAKIRTVEKTSLLGVLYQLESILKVTKVYTCKTNYTIFYK